MGGITHGAAAGVEHHSERLMVTEPTQDTLIRGRGAFARKAWAEARTFLLAADRAGGLAPDDLERLGTAAYLAGEDAESEVAWTRAHQDFLQAGEPQRAAACGFWVAFVLQERGESAPASGWIARARRILDGVDGCAQRGYLLLPGAVRDVYQGEYARAYDLFSEAASLGARYGDAGLVAFARHGQGRTLLRMGRRDEGMALLDEAMAAVEAGEVAPIFAGDIYCSVIEACHEAFDLRRAGEWTEALSRWCESQPELVPYRGHCLIRRAEILQLRGEWSGAADEARRACEWLMRPPPRRAVGAAFYQRGELHRLRGDFTSAEEAYRLASEWGRRPEPGLALLRLARGQPDAAATAIQLALDEAADARARCRLLPARIEIALATADLEAARVHAAELSALAREMDSPLLQAHSEQAEGAVLLAEGHPRDALVHLRRAADRWRELDAPYEGARARTLIARASRELGDTETAEMELAAARAVFHRLGAAPDLARGERLTRVASVGVGPRLTPRELQVLRLVAAGNSNRTIAAELHLSERTVERHVSKVLMKLGLSSRSAATAYAFRNHLV